MMTHQPTIRSFKSPKSLWRWAAVASILMIALSLTETAQAQTEESGDVSRLHLRFGVGLVFTAEATNGENAPVSYSTTPGILDCVQLGGRLNSKFSLFFQADSLVMFETEESDLSIKSENVKDEAIKYGFLTGIGTGYYGLPGDIYMSAALGMALSDVSVGRDSDTLNSAAMGFGFSATVAKTWWSTNDVDFGVAGQFLFMATQGEHTSRLNKHTAAFGALLVASFN